MPLPRGTIIGSMVVAFLNSPAKIFVGVPAFRGSHFLPETLRSIRDQTFEDIRVVISIDGEDTETASACDEFLVDHRFTRVIQTERLGWAGNLNWLMERCDAPVFCFWQQDDFASANYLAELYAVLSAEPEAVCAYSDIQWFGGETARTVLPSLDGVALERALTLIDGLTGVPLRGLIRRDAIARTGSIRVAPDDSAFEEIVWLSRLAREGALLRVEGPLYFKRKHAEATHGKWFTWPPQQRRRVWIRFGVSAVETLAPLIGGHDFDGALVRTLERLCFSGAGRPMFYDPAAELDAFAADAAAAIHEKYPSARLARLLTESASGEHSSSGLVLRAARVLRARADLQAAADREGFLALHPTPGSSALCLLEEGWSAAEGWGTWSVGETARIRLPIPPDRRRWQVELELEAFGIPGSLARVGVCLDEREPVEVEFTPGTVEQVALAAEPGLGRRILQLTSPNAIAPASFSVSSDVRRLGVGLRAITLRRT